MINDIEQNKGTLCLSYFDKNGDNKIANFDLGWNNFPNWKVCPEHDPAKDLRFRNWDGQPVKRVMSNRFNKFSTYEFIENLPEKQKEEITGLYFPKMYFIDIETEVVDGFPKPEIAKEAITAISVVDLDYNMTVMGCKDLTEEEQFKLEKKVNNYFKKIGTMKFTVTFKYYEHEYDMMYDFITRMVPTYPLMTGWNFIRFDWTYIFNRCKRLGIDPASASPVGRLKYKDNYPMHVATIDYLDVYKRWDVTVKVKENNKLDYVANQVLGASKISYKGTLQELYDNDYENYLYYNAVDTALVMLIHEKLKTLNSVLAIGIICNLAVYKTSSPIAMTEALMFKKFYKYNKVIADEFIESERGDYEGAYVKEPVPGLYKSVVSYDFASLYPSIMQQFNISPESYIDQREIGAEIPENAVQTTNGSVFDNSSTSVTKEILMELYGTRKKEKAKKISITNSIIPAIEAELKRRGEL